MLIKSSQLCNHNARTERIPTPGRTTQTGQALRLLKPAEAMHELFMSASCFYASHRQIAMSQQMVAALRTMKIQIADPAQQRQKLSEAINVVAANIAHRDAGVRSALDTARLSLLAYS